MGLDGERQKQHRHSGRVGARPDQFDGRRHSAGTLQHFTCPLFHRWVDFVFFLFGFDHFWRWHLVDRRQPQHPAAGKFLRQGDDVAPVPPWHHLRGCRPAGAVQRRHHLLLIAGIHQVRACNWRHVQYYSSFPPPLGGCNTSILFSFMAIILWAAANQSYNNNLRRQGTGGNHPDRLDRFVNCIPFSPLVLLPCLSHNGVCVCV